MTEKVLIEVYVPSLNQSYDLFIPSELPMHKGLKLIKKAIFELSDGRFIPSNNVVICKEDGKQIDINLSVYELGIINGSKLILI